MHNVYYVTYFLHHGHGVGGLDPTVEDGSESGLECRQGNGVVGALRIQYQVQEEEGAV